MAYIHSWVIQEWEAPKCPMETAERGGLVSWEAFLLPSCVCFQEPERVEQIMRWALSTAQSALKKCFWSTGVKASSRRAVFFYFVLETALSRISFVRKWRSIVSFIFYFSFFYLFPSVWIPWMVGKGQRSWSSKCRRPEHRHTSALGVMHINGYCSFQKQPHSSGNPSPEADRRNHFRAV